MFNLLSYSALKWKNTIITLVLNGVVMNEEVMLNKT